jgi:hypothetical protein
VKNFSSVARSMKGGWHCCLARRYDVFNHS